MILDELNGLMIERDQIEFNIKLESYKTILKLINDLEK